MSNNIYQSFNDINLIENSFQNYSNKFLILKYLLLFIVFSFYVIYFYLVSIYFGELENKNNYKTFSLYCILIAIYIVIIRNTYLYLKNVKKTYCNAIFCILTHIIFETLFLIWGICEIFYFPKNIINKQSYNNLINSNIYIILKYTLFYQIIYEFILFIILFYVIIKSFIEK